VSEPEAKQYLLDAIEHCRKAISALTAAGDSKGDALKKSLEETVQLLEGLQEKVFFKTKKAVAPTFQVCESSQAVAERAEDMEDADDEAITELKDLVGQLKDSVATLQAASKTQSVIVT